MSIERVASRRRGPSAGATALLVLVSTLWMSPAAAVTACTQPPAIIPQEQLTPGTLGNGLTTLGGTTPVPFTFEVIGTIPDGWMLGLDAIVIRITGPRSFLDQTGGVFFGMSGSPAYVNGRLAGAVSGVFDDPTFGVLTPAADMLEVLDAAGSAAPLARTIRPTPAIRRAIAEASGVPVSEVTGSFHRLRTPLGVAGLSPAVLEELQRRLDERGESFWVYPASSTPTPGRVTPTPFRPGEPLGAAISYGDAAIYATGTATFTCGGSVVAFGHPFFSDAPGRISLGLSGAKGLMVVKGGQGLWPGYRFALLTDPRGTIVQDRFAGIAGVIGVEPTTIPIRSTLRSRDSGDSRTGTTEAIHTWGYWIEEILWSHLAQNFAAVLGHLGPGTADLAWTITGTTPEGPFEVSNRWMTSSPYDATAVIGRLLNAVDRLQFNPYEPVTFTAIDTTGSITEERLEGKLVRIRLASTSQPALRVRGGTVRARPGDRLTIEATFERPNGGLVVTTVSVRVPELPPGLWEVHLRGGRARSSDQGGPPVALDSAPPGGDDAGSFAELIQDLNGGEHPNDLIMEGLGGQRTWEQDLVIHGHGTFRVRIVR